VREGYRVIDEQIRRGRRTAQEHEDEPWSEGSRRSGRSREPWPWPEYEDEEPRSRYSEEPWSRSRGPFDLLGMPMRHLERLLKEILRQVGSARPDPLRLAGLLFQLQVEAIAELTRLGFGALGAGSRWRDAYREDAYRGRRDVDESLRESEEEYETYGREAEEEPADEPWEWPAAPSAPAVIRASVPIPVWVWSHERTEIDLELPPGAQPVELEVEPPVAVGTGEPPAPAFEAEFVALADGPVVLRVEVPRELPAGLYPRRIVTRVLGEPVGVLTVQVGTLPPTPEPGPSPRQKSRQKEKKR
jgi:hypothetical protein